MEKSVVHFKSFCCFLSFFPRKQAQTAESQVAIHSYSLLQSQIWSLLPSFCHNVPDLQENFKGIAKILGVIITEYKDIRIPVMTALRRLITFNRDNYNESNVKELKKFAKNYLPILFNVYTTKPSGSDEAGQRLAALETIKVYLTISTPELTQELFDKAFEKLDQDDVNEFTRESILDLLRCLISYQNTQKLNILFSRIEKSIRDPKSGHQKKSYRLLEELCSNSAESCRVFVKDKMSDIENLLLNSMTSCTAATKGPRIRCLIYLVQNMEKHEISTLKKIIPEAVLCCKDNNEKCRESAFSLLILIGDTLERLSDKNKTESLEEYISLLMAGLSGPATLVSATLLALGKVIYEYKDVMSNDLHKLLLDNVCLLVVSAVREIVASALSFIKAFTKSISIASLGPFVPPIVKSLLAMTEDCKRHFRQKCRDILDRFIRKFGYDAVAGLVPTNDVIMHKRLRNLKKMNERKKKKSLNDDDEDEEADENDLFILRNRPKTIEEILEESDSDFEDTSNKDSQTTKKKRHNTWIHEDADSIVDFMDAGANKKIVASLPSLTNNIVEKLKKKKDDMPFKMSSDGRLIVTDDGSDDEGGRRRNAQYQEDSDDEMDDTVSRAESVQGTVNRKRKLTVGSNASEPPSKYQAGGSGIHRPVAKSKSKNSKKGPVGTTGEEYRAKKGKGDIKKKGLPDPYAYVPLSRKLLNRRKKIKHAGQFKNLVRGAGKGAQKGSLMKKKNIRK
ncbi:hypothetical protein R5R35_001055 [Gryllus longicercus]|uniref:RRP12 HEAT domain-containing protein n=1 Tax=Gryllus longicercus TaxID=2509291 RepID=A0AAN9V8H1_9ORTH